MNNKYRPNAKYNLALLFRDFFSFELIFVLFLFAGFYKGDPRLEWVSVDLTAVFFVLSIITGLIIMLKKKLVFKKSSLVLISLYIAFAGFTLLSYLWTPGEIYSTQKVLYICTLVLWAQAAPALIISIDIVRLKRLGIIFCLLSVILVIEVIIGYFQAGQQGFIRVLGSNYLGTGRIIGIACLLVVVYFIFWARDNYEKILSIVIAVLYFWILLIAGGRGPFLATVFSALVPMFFAAQVSLGRLAIRVRRYAFSFLIIVILFILIIIYLFVNGEMTQTISRILVLTETDMGTSAGVRLQYYVNSIEYWTESPIIGHGIGSWPIINNGIDMRGYPHNIILEILVELGFIGVALFSTFIFYAVSLLVPLKSIKDQPTKILLIMLIVYAGSNSMVSGDIPDNRFLFACIGLMPAAPYVGGGRKYD